MFTPSPEEILQRRIDELSKSSEAGVALVTVALLDFWLAESLLKTMTNQIPSLFKRRGAMSDFASKIDIAFAFGMIDETTSKDLHTLRRIRNSFAHTAETVHFNSPKIDDVCKKLRGWTPDSDNRELFNKIAFECASKMSKVLSMVLATAPKLNDLVDQYAATVETFVSNRSKS